MGKLKSVSFPVILATVILIAMIILNTFNTGSPGGADSYLHFLFAKWAFNYPRLFFDHWGKPLFIILSSPFAQFGFKGAVTFNIILSVLSGFLVYKSGQKMNLKNAWLGIVFTVFTPIFFYISFSSLTEILFAFLVIASVYLFIREQFFWSIVVMSFVPFARTEGVIFFPIFMLALIYLKQYKYISLLFVGFIFMAIVGYSSHHEFLWPITKNPYHDTEALYGHGTFDHFLKYSTILFGRPLIVLFLIGVISSIRAVFVKRMAHHQAVVFLLLSISFGYFAAHSFVWAFGMGGSAGLIRVIAGIAPVVALVSLIGFDMLFGWISTKKTVSLGIGVILSGIVIKAGVSKNTYPIPIDLEMAVLKKATDYLKQEKLDSNYIVYYNPTVAFLLDLDPFSDTGSRERVPNPKIPNENLPQGTILVWDTHFSPTSGGLPQEVLNGNKEYTRVKDFQPDVPFKVYTGQDYEVLLYQISNKR